jgi:hypothetical protein
MFTSMTQALAPELAMMAPIEESVNCVLLWEVKRRYPLMQEQALGRRVAIALFTIPH